MEEQTARTRIRDAAISLFAEQGMAATTIRGIAKSAGVSGGLLRHHFGSKDDLHAACDTYVLDHLMDYKRQAILEGRVADVGFMSAAHPKLLLMNRYIARSVADESPAATAMFDIMVELTEQWLNDNNPGHTDDVHTYSALLVAMEIGALNMSTQLSRSIGADIFGPEGHLRLLKTKVDFYSNPLIDPKFAAQSRATIDQLLEQQTSKSNASTPKGKR
jgi:AcrR family transcriptional regulator